LPGNDANSPSITNQLRNEELQRRKAVTNNYDMFADDYSDTNVKMINFKLKIGCFPFFKSPNIWRSTGNVKENENKHLQDNWDDSEGYYREY